MNAAASESRQPIKRFALDGSSSEAVVHDGVVYVSALAPDVQAGGAAQQLRSIAQRLEQVLLRCGSSKYQILHATIYCTDSRYFEEVLSEWSAWAAWHDLPACNLLVARLGVPRQLVAVQVTAGG